MKKSDLLIIYDVSGMELFEPKNYICGIKLGFFAGEFSFVI